MKQTVSLKGKLRGPGGLILVSALLLFCTNGLQPHSGGVNDSPNSAVASIRGEAVMPDGSAAGGVTVRLRRRDYLATPTLAKTRRSTVDRGDTVTDEHGRFVFDSVDTGAYYLEINGNSGLAAGIVLDATGDSSLEATPLDTVVSVSGTVDLTGLDNAPVYVQIFGMERVAEVNREDGSFMVDDLPAGSHTVRVLPTLSFVEPDTFETPPLPGGADFTSDSIKLYTFDTEDYTAWDHSRRFTLTTSGLAMSEDVHGFPLLVRLDESVLDFSEAAGDGRDIRFADAAGRPIRYEIDGWDSIAKRAAAWVRLDTVPADSALDITMYWGNPAARNFSSGEAVFDTALGFAGVWHMELTEQANDTVVEDVTRYGAHGRAVKYGGDERVEGCINSAVTSDESHNYLLVGSHPQHRLDSTITISAWVRGWGYGKIVNKIEGNEQRDYSFYFWGSTPVLSASVGTDTATGRFYSSGSVTPDSLKWNYVALTFDGRTLAFQTNGHHDNPQATAASVLGSDARLTFQSDAAGGSRFLRPLDEVRISRTVRSPTWLMLCYETQKPDGGVVVWR